ncbi:hypothetical protein RKD31_001226 [Streptomyces sp. SAI-163]
MGEVVGRQTELAEDDGERDRDEQLAPAVPQGDESGDTAGEREGDGAETDRVVQRAAPEQIRVGYAPGEFGEVAPLLASLFPCGRGQALDEHR